MKKDTLIFAFIVLLGIVLYGLTLRGAIGTPVASEIKGDMEPPTSPFELSPERGRYVQVANMAERGVYNLSKEWAAVAYPDVGISADGKMNSFFAPGVSYFALPFYLLGSHFGLGQIASFSVESFISIITLIFIYLVGTRVFALPRWAALFSVLIYGFGSTSWSYAITLYQNAFTACFIITAFYAAWRFSQDDTRYRFLYAAYVWLAYALAITVDYPNAVLMLPVMVYFAVSTFSIKQMSEGVAVSVRWSAIATFVVFAFVTGLHFWHNATYYGGWSHLAGELKNYNPKNGAEATSTTFTPTSAPSTATSTIAAKNKTAVGFFHEHNIPISSFVLLFSDERGLFFFSPIFLLSVLGILYVLRKKESSNSIYIVPIALIAVNIFLYSAWGDPWGGWAYGPRYLIPSMPWLSLFVAVTLTRGRFVISKKIIAFVLFLFSSAVALLGALTTNAVPPASEGLLLPARMYNYLLNLNFLQLGKSSSFMYKTFFQGQYSLTEYFFVIYAIAIMAVICTFLLSYVPRHE